MNRIHRLVWNHALNAWVVAHEHAAAHGKQTSRDELSVPVEF